jgi:hypothetical protein
VIAPKYQPFNTNSQTHVTILGHHLKMVKKIQQHSHYPSLIKQNEWLLKE